MNLKIAILTISDTRTNDNDKSGDYLENVVLAANHQVLSREIVPDDIYKIRAIVSQWIARQDIEVVLTTGGTGFAHRDVTPQALQVLFDKDIPGFGEVFRNISLGEIGSSTIQSRAFAGMANNTVIFSMPGSTGACRTAWENIIAEQLDSSYKPCNFTAVIQGGR